MRRLVLLLVPAALFAQVVVDTVIRGLPSGWLGRSYFIPELNKLYISGHQQFLVIDCSTYHLKSQIVGPSSADFYAWNPRRQKLYVNCNPYPDSTIVIDVTADSIAGWLTYYRETHAPPVYVADLDRVYKPALETLYAFDCAADTVVRRIVPPWGFGIGTVSWDSVGRKLYCGGGVYGQAKLAVYDYVADSFTKVMNTGNASGINCFVFNQANHKAYFGPYGPEPWGMDVGIFDTQRDTVVALLPAPLLFGVYDQIAVDERDGKVYIAVGDGALATPDTLWVVDCATDSVLKKLAFERTGYGAEAIRWVPWSNRIYLSCSDWDSSRIVVVDCNTDSIIVPDLRLGHKVALDIQLDSIRQRIFVIGADSGTIHVLRDVGYGVEEDPNGEVRVVDPMPTIVRGVLVLGAVGSRQNTAHRAELLDAAGRKVAELQPGVHDVRALAPGVYFVREEPPALGFTPPAVRKVVITK